MIRMLSLGAHFMEPYWAPEIPIVSVELDRPLDAQLEPHRDATFAYAMNSPGGETQQCLWAARDICRRLGIPTIWHTIEDPNSLSTFGMQPQGFDLIATSDAECIPHYERWHPHAKVIWLPLAAQPAMHIPAPTAEDAADFVFIGNWYVNEARQAAVHTVLDPILEAGYTLELYAYTSPTWPARYRKWWKAATSCYDVARFYPRGKVALGWNNQARGTAMTSMRTYEVLACGKPLLAFHSDAYRRLGFENGIHFVWTDNPHEALEMAERLLTRPSALAMAERGRNFVLSRHTYAHRLQTILEALGIRDETHPGGP